MRKPNIGIDLDGVICDLPSAVYPLLGDMFKIDVKAKDLSSIENVWEKEFNLTNSQLSSLFVEAGKRGLYRTAKVYEDTRKHLVNISKQYNIFYITVRDFYPTIKKDTFYWLDRNKLPYYRVVFSRSKHKIAERENLQFFIDDSPDYCNRVAKTRVPTWLFRRPWNKNAPLDPLVKITDSWAEIEEILTLE
jgi:uncharacterized HAD superfamily protein